MRDAVVTCRSCFSRAVGFKIKLGQALNAYLSSYNGISVNLRNRLDNLQKAFDLYGEPPSKSLDMPMMDAVNINVLQFEESVMDRPVMNARAGLYIYINAIVSILVSIDDADTNGVARRSTSCRRHHVYELPLKQICCKFDY